MLKRLSISNKLIALFLFVGIVPLTIIGLFSTVKLKEAIKDRAVKQLISIRESKKDQTENYFEMIKDQVIEHSRERTIIDAAKEFTEAFWKIERELDAEYESNKIENERGLRERYQYQKDNTYESPSDAIAKWWPEEKVSRILQHLYISTNPKAIGHKYELDYAPDGSTYSEMHKKYHPLIRNYLERFLGYYDIFLIEPKTGYIVYSTFKELDFATSLLTGPYKNTNLAKAFGTTLDSNNEDFVSLIDFEPYEPSYNHPAAFIASPIYDGGNKVGVLAFQMPINRINDIMTSHWKWRNVGLGSSVETYLVGEDFTMRNDSRFFIETPGEYFKQIELLGYPKEMINKIRVLNTTILLQKVKTPGTEDALKGNTGFGIFPDYRNIRVLSAYTSLNIEGIKWFLMSEIDEDEAFRAANMLRNTILAVVLAIAILVLIVGIFAARSISGPVKLLSRTAEEIGKGNLNKQVDIKSQDEIGVLAAAFNKMTTNLKQITASRDELNKEITERKRAEEALKASQAQLIQSEKMSALGTLVAGVAHELNNPLMGIINYIQYCLKNTSSDDEKFTVLHDAEQETKRCISIVDNLLTFSYKEKESEEGFQKGSCATILDQVLKLLSYPIEKERVQVIKHYDEGIPEIGMRVNSIQQAFLNIITNALEALKESEKKEISIETHKEGEYVQVTIADSGTGIAPENLQRIFDPFFTTKAPGQGTGLGLSICQGIIETHEGKITCNSKPGQGAKFEILLPIKMAKRKEAAK